MRVRFTSTLATTGPVFIQGHIYDLDYATAHSYLAAGIAEEIDADEPRKPERQTLDRLPSTPVEEIEPPKRRGRKSP